MIIYNSFQLHFQPLKWLPFPDCVWNKCSVAPVKMLHVRPHFLRDVKNSGREIKRSTQVEIIDYLCLLFILESPRPQSQSACTQLEGFYFSIIVILPAIHTDLCPFFAHLPIDITYKRHTYNIEPFLAAAFLEAASAIFHIKNSLRYFHVFVLYFLFSFFSLSPWML